MTKMIKAKIESGIVVNIIVVDPNNIPIWCADWPTATEDCHIGGTYANGVFSPMQDQTDPFPSEA